MGAVSEYIDKTEMLIRLKCLEPKKDDFKDDDCFQAAESQHDLICEYLKPMQSADVVPVVHGYWDDPDVNDKKISYCSPVKCSICGTINAPTAYTYNFCGHCGAKMMDMDEEAEK